MWRILAESDGIMALAGNYKMNGDYLFSRAPPYRRRSDPLSFRSHPAFVSPARSASALSPPPLLPPLPSPSPPPRHLPTAWFLCRRFRANHDQPAPLAPISALDTLSSRGSRWSPSPGRNRRARRGPSSLPRSLARRRRPLRSSVAGADVNGF